MLLLIAVLAVLSAAFLLFGITRLRRSDLPPARIPDTTQLRPLFEPSTEEHQAAEREAEAREIARREVRTRAEHRAKIDAAVEEWRARYSASAAASLLAVTAEVGDAKDFSRAAEEIIGHFREDGFKAVSANTVAQLIESHRLLLPVSERGSGTLFWIKEEVAKLRSSSGGSAAQKNS